MRLEAKRRKLEREKRELQNTVAETALATEPTDEQRAESRTAQERIVPLNGELNECETALDGMPEERFESAAPEDREFAALVSGYEIRQAVMAASGVRMPDGPTAEAQEHFGLDGNMVPLAVIRQHSRRHQPVEHRVSAAPGDTAASLDPIIGPIFVTGLAAYFGIPQPVVPVGEAVYTVLTNRPAVGGPHTTSDEVAETDATSVASSLEPSRLQAATSFRRTDASRTPGWEDALGDWIVSSLGEANDQELVDELVAEIGRTDAAAIDTFATYHSRLAYGVVDGRFAQREADVRLLVGSETLAHMGGVYRGNNSDTAVPTSFRNLGVGLRVSPLIAAAAGDKQDVFVRLGSGRDMVNPIWEGVEIIRDPYTKAKAGEIVLTAVMQSARDVLRDDAFDRIQSQHA